MTAAAAVTLPHRKPRACPFGHSLAPGQPHTVGWRSCACSIAREEAEPDAPLGHIYIWCIRCRTEGGRMTFFYEPPCATAGGTEPARDSTPRP